MTLHSKTRTPFDPADHTDVVSYDEASGETAIHRFDAMGELARTWWLVHESDGLYIAETSADQGEWRMTPTNWTAIHKIRLEALSTFAQLQYVVTEAVAFPLAVATWPGMIVSRWLRKRACDGARVNVLSYSLWPRRRRLFPVITHAAPHDQASASHVLIWPWALRAHLGSPRSARCGSLAFVGAGLLGLKILLGVVVSMRRHVRCPPSTS